GPNGAGKTTLLKILALLLQPSAGAVCYNDEPAVPSDTVLRRRISMLPQKPILLNGSVYDNLLFPLRLRGMEGDGSLARRWLEEVGLDAKLRQNALTLSGGEAQRLALARALVYRPEALFLDEPFLNLDPLSEGIVARIIARLRDEKRTVVLCLHDLERGFAFADVVYFLEAGKVARKGERNEFLPATVSQARFLGVENLFRGVIRGGWFQSGEARLQVLSERDGSAWVGVGSGQVIISLAPLASSARNILPGEVVSLREKGRLIEVEVNAGLPFLVLVTRESVEELDLRPGKKVFLAIKTSSLLIMEDHPI
ncbi:MAG: ATP-binding cassette domain-containing protein, partial [Candidatus Aureabacteria bacterium]|nr:ATP-binding cassette domain-containing protein [Candidatus Auribacterota bacterium]